MSKAIKIRGQWISLELILTVKAVDSRQLGKIKRLLGKSVKTLEKFLQGRDFEVSKKSQSEILLSLTICGDRRITSLNNNYRDKNRRTDVLSFPVHETLRKSEMSSQQKVFLFNAPSVHLGDIFVCCEVAKKQSKEFGVTFEQEVVYLFCHGFLHLLGFDHEASFAEDRLMRNFEDRLTKSILVY